jgi:hypothetical protein
LDTGLEPDLERERLAAPPARAPACAAAPVPAARSRILPWLSALFGIAVAAAAVATSRVLSADAPILSRDSLYWLASALLLALVAGFWLAGAARTVAMLFGDGRRPATRADALSCAFAMGPLLLALFFFPVAAALGFESIAEALTAAGVALFTIAVLVAGRTLFLRIAEELLLSLFAWLLLLVAPALWDDPVSRQAARFVIGLLRKTGLLP